jgi:hypothetical protein
MPPAPLPRKILLPFLILTAGLWGLAITGALSWSDQVTAVLAAGAATLTVTGITAWLIHGARDRDKELLIRGLVEASQRAAKAKTAPLRRVK